MATTRQLFVHYNKTGGMSRSGRPHNLAPEVWHLDFNMRTFDGKLRQLPLKKVRQYVTPHSGSTMMELCNLATKNGCVLVGLTDTKVKRIESGGGINLKEDGTEVTLNSLSGRYGTCVFNNRLFFVNENNAVKYTDGATVTSIGGTCPKGRYVEVWFDHLIVGGPIFPGEDLVEGVAWSHLNAWSNFTPDTDSEADRYIFTEYQNNTDVVPGVTGLRKLGNRCLVYTASSIYEMKYVGLPRVVRVDPLVQDFGCGLRYSLTGVNGAHYFIDWTAKNFMSFNGEAVKMVGTPIAEYFFATVSELPELQQKTWAYVDQRYREIWWVYASKASNGAYDRAVVFNYAEERWYAASAEDLHCFSTTIDDGSVTIDQLVGTIDRQNGSINQLGGSSGLPVRLWGGPNERIMREETAEDSTEDLLAQELPVLETGDEVFGGIQTVKETDGIAVQSTMDSIPPLLEVELSTRENLDDRVVFDRVALWDPTKSPVSTFKKQAGRVIRWRFHPTEHRTFTKVPIYQMGVTGFQMRTNMPNTYVAPPPPDPVDEVGLAEDTGELYIWDGSFAIASTNPTFPPELSAAELTYWKAVLDAEWNLYGPVGVASKTFGWWFPNHIMSKYDFNTRYAADAPTVTPPIPDAYDSFVEFASPWLLVYVYTP